VATLGLFSPELVPKAWFSPELYPIAWFDRTLVGEAASVTVQDEPAYVSTFVGVETVGSYVVGDVAVVVQAVAPAEAEAALVVTDTGVFVEAFSTSETLGLYVVSDAAVDVAAFVGVEQADVVYYVLDTSVPVEALVPNEVVSTTSEDPAVAVDVFVGVEVLTSLVEDAAVLVEALSPAESVLSVVVDDAGVLVEAFASSDSIGLFVVDDPALVVEALVPSESADYVELVDASAIVEALSPSESFALGFADETALVDALVPAEYVQLGLFDSPVFVSVLAPAESVAVPGTAVDDVAVVVDAQVSAESLSVTPAPGPTPPVAQPRGGGGTPLEDYLIDGVPVREWRQVLDGEKLLEEIVELPVREETDEEREAREKGEPRFSGLLTDIIAGPVPEKDEPKVVSLKTAALFALGAFALGAIVASVLSRDDDEDDEDDVFDELDEPGDELDEDLHADDLDEDLEHELEVAGEHDEDDEDEVEDEDEELERPSALQLLRELRQERLARESGSVGWEFFATQGRVVRDAPRAVDKLIERHTAPLEGAPSSEEVADAARFVFSGGVEEPLLSPQELANRFGA